MRPGTPTGVPGLFLDGPNTPPTRSTPAPEDRGETATNPFGRTRTCCGQSVKWPPMESHGARKASDQKKTDAGAEQPQAQADDQGHGRHGKRKTRLRHGHPTVHGDLLASDER